MRSNRRRNWFIKRIALGLAVAAFAAAVAQASVDNGWPGVNPSNYALAGGDQIELVRAQPRSTGSDSVAADYGMPRALPHDYALVRGDQIEVVRAQPNGTSSDKIEFVRSQPRSTGSGVVARYLPGHPSSAPGSAQVTASNINWDDAGIGAGLALALVLLGGGAALASRHLGRAQTA